MATNQPMDSVPVMWVARADYERLRKINVDLYEALRDVLAFVGPGKIGSHPVEAKALAALARAEGK